MQNFLTISAIVVLGFVGQIQADSIVTYTGNLTGIDCDGCKRTIASSIAKLKGVKTIKINKKSEGSHTLTVVTNGSKEITKSQASKALGKKSHYKITSWSSSSKHSH